MLNPMFRLLGCCTLAAMLNYSAWGADLQESSPSSQDLSALSLEDLTKIDVSSVARKSQELFKTPAAVFVITREDIKASGVDTLPDLFRMVPGMQVAQVTATAWAVSARGFNSRFADKMLVLIDGRSVYSEIYSGVFWDQNDIALKDIDRIEVIRGPGGTLWGANAVNGVINIITLSANQTLGTELVAIGGSLQNGVSIRHGAELGSNFRYREYLKYIRHNALRADDGTSANDSGDSMRIGARGDWQSSPKDLVTVHGDFFRGSEQQRAKDFSMSGGSDYVLGSVHTIGGYGLGRWEHHFAGSDFAFQTYYTDSEREELAGTGREHILDFDFQNHLPSIHQNDIVWGLSYRLTTDHIVGTPATFSSDRHHDAIEGLFFEDEYAILPNRLVFIAGLKLQHNSYTGLEIQPGGRVLWTPNKHQTLWTAVYRAVRTPSVQERDLHFFESLPPENGLSTEALALGNPKFLSEVVVAYEAGYRQTLGKKVWLDFAGFTNSYSKLRDQDFLTPYIVTAPAVTLIVPIQYTNDIAAKSHGVEVAASWNVTHSLRLQASYAWMNAHLRLPDGAPPTHGDNWSTPTNTLDIRSTWNFARHWMMNSSVYSASRLERESPSPGVPLTRQYVRLDTHVSYDVSPSFRFTVGIDNILQKRHPEFDPEDGYTVRSQVPRSASVKAVWSF